MKQAVLIIAALLVTAPLHASEKTVPAPKPGSARGGETTAAHAVISKRCTACHSSAVIDAALKDKKDMLKIQKDMEKRGAKLNSKEREVLGIFWKEQNPLKK